MFNLLKMLVEFTPTQKDDEVLAQFESFIENNPELAAMAVKFIFKLLRTKDEL